MNEVTLYWVLLVLLSSTAVNARALRPATSEQQPRPNFIVIVTDDQGWDDIGLHNPDYVKTPNIDRFIRGATLFDNFYTTPQCAQTRAAVLTGRHHVRTGTMLVSSGWDLSNPAEATAGAVMSEAGYATAMFGKWAHSSQVQGYEPWHAGFAESYVRSKYEPDMLLRHNGRYEHSGTNGTYRFAEQALMSRVINYLARQAPSNRQQGQQSVPQQPFFMYYAPRAIHTSPTELFGGPQRFSPPEMLARYMADPKYTQAAIANTTVQAWAALEYLDKVVGRLFDYLAVSGLDKTTYVMLLSDNGSALLPNEGSKANRMKRMPSGMLGGKSDITEGGIRNFLAVRGPDLSPNRTVLKPQALFNWDKGAVVRKAMVPGERLSFPGPGLTKCLAVRHKDLKWIGRTGKVYRFTGGNHIELPRYELPRAQASKAADTMAAAARSWWRSVVSEPYSFQKAALFVGMGNESYSNIMAMYAHDRTPANVTLLDKGATGFVSPGDRMCWNVKVMSDGVYNIVIMYTSIVEATFKLAVGDYKSLLDSSSPSITARLPAMDALKGMSLGNITLKTTTQGSAGEACLTLINTTKPGAPVFKNLANLRF
ncbi:hypothetical protein OEZ86_013993, partial [Tetradesmus obliquus]